MNCVKYVITIPTTPEKKMRSIKELDRIFGPLSYEVFEGVDARDFIFYSQKNDVWSIDKSHSGVTVWENFFGRPIGEILTEDSLRGAIDPWMLHNPGGVGCTISHAMVMHQFLTETNLPFMAIFEDDIRILDDSTLEEFNRVLQNLPKDLPVVAMLHSRTGKNKVFDRSSFRPLSDVRGLYRNLNHELHYKELGYDAYAGTYRVSSAAAYILNRLAVEKILSNMFPLSFVSDWFHVYFERGLIKEMWCVEPCWATIRDEDSSTENSSIQLSYAGLRHPVRFFAKLCIRKNIPLVSQLLRERRKRVHGSLAGQAVEFI